MTVKTRCVDERIIITSEYDEAHPHDDGRYYVRFFLSDGNQSTLTLTGIDDLWTFVQTMIAFGMQEHSRTVKGWKEIVLIHPDYIEKYQGTEFDK